MIHFSVIVCSYNRCESLRETLIALQEQAYDKSRWELIVVDNNSPDETRQVVEEFVSADLNVRYFFEPQQGLSYARNTGVKNANGEYIVFTDDDVIPEKNWLESLDFYLEKYSCDACGGYISPIWEVTPPKWLSETFYGFLALKIETELKGINKESPDLPFGANMAFKRSLFDKFGGFDTNRGRKGSVLASGEDGEFFQRILAGGAIVFYFPDVRVNHKIEAFRTKKRYFRRWRYQTSKNIAIAHGVPRGRLFLGAPMFLYVQLLRATAKAFLYRITKPADIAFRQEIIIWHFFGLIFGIRESKIS